MAQTPVTNFGKATVSTTYDAVATSIVLTTGHGSRFPSTFPYPLTWYNATDYPDPADDPNREIVTVTARSTDTLTVTRGAEGTGASTKNTAGKTYKMILGITKAMWDDLSTQNLPQSFRTLTVRNHPDQVAQKVVFSAEGIVMNDGEYVPTWSAVAVNLATSGVGGLDTGSAVASTWYELYAIWNGTTKSGCFHRAKNWLLDQDITAGEDASQGVNQALDNSNSRVAQGFTPAVSGLVSYIDVKLLRTGSLTNSIYFELRPDSAGVPHATTILATSWSIPGGRIPTTATIVRVPFLTPGTVSAGTKFHIVARALWTADNTNYISWRMDGSAATYTGGNKALYDTDTSTWTQDTDDDMWLKVYIEQNNVDFGTTVPSGYSYARLGYAYNGSSNVIRPYTQMDRVTRYYAAQVTGQAVNELAVAPTLYDLSAFVPCQQTVMTLLTVTGTGAAVQTTAVGSIAYPEITFQSTTTGSFAHIRADTNVEVIEGGLECPIEYQAVIADASGAGDLYVLGFTW